MESKPQRILAVSDIHRGAFISDLPRYEKKLLEEMRNFDHVVFDGDVFELFYIDPEFYGMRESNKFLVKRAIAQSIGFMEDFLKENPTTHLHFVLGNHENIQRFRKRLDKLQDKYTNFEWSPEAIRIGDALFTHGDLQMDKQTEASRGTYRMRQADKEAD